jgi:hypothetical protein
MFQARKSTAGLDFTPASDGWPGHCFGHIANFRPRPAEFANWENHSTVSAHTCKLAGGNSPSTSRSNYHIIELTAAGFDFNITVGASMSPENQPGTESCLSLSFCKNHFAKYGVKLDEQEARNVLSFLQQLAEITYETLGKQTDQDSHHLHAGIH